VTTLPPLSRTCGQFEPRLVRHANRQFARRELIVEQHESLAPLRRRGRNDPVIPELMSDRGDVLTRRVGRPVVRLGLQLPHRQAGEAGAERSLRQPGGQRIHSLHASGDPVGFFKRLIDLSLDEQVDRAYNYVQAHGNDQGSGPDSRPPRRPDP